MIIIGLERDCGDVVRSFASRSFASQSFARRTKIGRWRSKRIAARFADLYRIVRTEIPSDPDTQSSLLSFCGIEPARQTTKGVHIHKSTSR